MKYSKRLAHRVIEGQAFVLEPREKTLHSLNETASVIWKLIGSGSDEAAIAEALCREFDVTREQALRDTRDFLRRLKSMRLVEDA